MTPENLAPPGAIVAEIQAADGVRLRTARWSPPDSPRGTVAIFGGRGEFIEKYSEVVDELLSRNFGVALMDWRGQGGSARPLRNPRKGHVDDFSHFVRDLDAFTASVLKSHCPRPWFGLAHSLGAAVLLIADEAGRCPFDRLVLVSPMIALKGVSLNGPASIALEALDMLGLGGTFVPGEGSGNMWSRPFEGNVFTTDPARFERVARLIAAAPEYSLGGPTIGWANAAFRAMRRFQDPNFPRRTTTPILVIAAGSDRVTDTRAAERFASRLGRGRIIVIDGAEHEILIERDHFRRQFWAAFDAFVPGSEAENESAKGPPLAAGVR